MRVHIQCHRDLAMPQNLLHYFGMNFHGKKNSCRTVSKIVEAHVRCSLVEHNLDNVTQAIDDLKATDMEDINLVILNGIPIDAAYTHEIQSTQPE
jgi:hypothetical protein